MNGIEIVIFEMYSVYNLKVEVNKWNLWIVIIIIIIFKFRKPSFITAP